MADTFLSSSGPTGESLFQFISRHADMLRDRETKLGSYSGDGPTTAQASELVDSLRPFTEEPDVTPAQTWEAFRMVTEVETAWLFPERDPLAEPLIFGLRKAQELIGKWLVDSGTLKHDDLDKFVSLHLVEQAAKRQVQLKRNGINWRLLLARFLYWEESAIADRHSSQIARASFDALRCNPPPLWDETAVADYNNILQALQAAEPDKDFSSFQVPSSELVPRETGFIPATRRAPGRTFYSSKLYCDSGRMLRRVESVAGYLAAVDAPAQPLPAIETTQQASHSGWFRRSAPATGKFFVTLVQSVVTALVNAALKRRGLE